MERLWILIGMMGSGKTTIGRELAKVADRPFLDTDQMLQARLGRSISELFRVYGEPAFRDHETSVLRGLQPQSAVLATGGGIVLREANWAEMRRLGTTIYLESSHEALCARLARSNRKRPLLKALDWRERVRSILEARRALYEQADVRVVAEDLPAERITQAILTALGVRP